MDLSVNTRFVYCYKQRPVGKEKGRFMEKSLSKAIRQSTEEPEIKTGSRFVTSRRINKYNAKIKMEMKK
jgi:hypothetical protein